VPVEAAIAKTWVERWDRQQEHYMADREERFTALIDAVQSQAGRTDPLVLDLGCGPGSLGVRLLERLPAATVVGVDADPVTLELGRALYGDQIRFVSTDLRAPGWSASLSLDRAPDAVVSTTALHWLPEPELRQLYAELAGLLRPGGLFLDGDHFRENADRAPVLTRLGRAIPELEYQRRFASGQPETWGDWWEAAAADPELGPLTQERARLAVSAHHEKGESVLLDQHVDALRAAGFAEVGTLWQRGDSRLLCAVR
jgi:SAM-dependent methyltransferase